MWEKIRLQQVRSSHITTLPYPCQLHGLHEGRSGSWVLSLVWLWNSRQKCHAEFAGNKGAKYMGCIPNAIIAEENSREFQTLNLRLHLTWTCTDIRENLKVCSESKGIHLYVPSVGTTATAWLQSEFCWLCGSTTTEEGGTSPLRDWEAHYGLWRAPMGPCLWSGAERWWWYVTHFFLSEAHSFAYVLLLCVVCLVQNLRCPTKRTQHREPAIEWWCPPQQRHTRKCSKWPNHLFRNAMALDHECFLLYYSTSVGVLADICKAWILGIISPNNM